MLLLFMPVSVISLDCNSSPDPRPFVRCLMSWQEQIVGWHEGKLPRKADRSGDWGLGK